MVRKKLAMAILALSALHANFANALGLGNLSIKSALNQPLTAEIKLLDTGDLDPTQVKIQLANPEDFQRSGVDRDYFLTNLRFTVVMDGKGGGTIHITTREPVVEPYLNFVIEARWPSGRLLREFAVLLDPPTFSANKGAGLVAPATIAPAQPAKKAPAIQPPTVTSETAATKTVPDADISLPATGKSGEYRVQVYDTLSKIAARYKPASDVSVAQTMLAIQRANPDAFINNNINLIKSGAIVRIPTADDARAIPTAQAAQEAEDQTHAWRSGSAHSGGGSTTAAAGPQLDASAPEPTKAEGGYREKARLSIAAPGGSDKATAGEGAGGKGTEALRAQLTSSQEALEKGKRDNRELQSRLDDMERQIATLQRLISLKDDQLTALQGKAAADKAGATKPADTAAATPPAATLAPVPTPAPAVDTTAATTAPTSEVVATPPAVQPVPVPAQPAVVKPVPDPKPAPEPSLLDQIKSNPLYQGAVAVALLLVAAIIALVIKRRKEAEEDEDSAGDFTLDDTDTFQFPADSDSTLINEDAISDNSGERAFNAVEPAPIAEEPKKIVRPETGDAIAESDIYIAYGRYQQAVDLLSNAIDAEPKRSDLRVKLLEVYVEMRNRDAFRQQFAKLQDLGDSNAVAQVKDMLSSVDGVSDWLDDLPAGSSPYVAPATIAAASATASALVAADHENEVGEVVAESVDELSDLDELGDLDELDDLDGELDLDFDETASAENSPTFDNSFGLPPEVSVSNELEFNLDLDADTDTDAASSQELSDLTLDFDSAPLPTAVPAANFKFDPTAENIDDGLELDLGDDDLDDMLGELGGSEELADLEDIAPPSAEPIQQWQQPAVEPEPAPEFDLSEEFDLSNAGEDLASPPATTEIDVFAGFDQPASETTDFTQSEPEPVTEPVSTPVVAPTLDSGDDFDFLSDSDEVATKLDLARAYIDMGDTDGARDILDEVLQEGTDTQKQEASSLLGRIG